MRGKLRDKRSDSKQDRIKHEQLERRRITKRESRITILQIEQLQEENLLDTEEIQLQTSNHSQP